MACSALLAEGLRAQNCSLRPRLRSGMLPKYCIGDLKLAPGEAPPTTYEEDLGEGQFYHTLKKRADAYFKDTQARARACAPEDARH